jgi:acyl dehydratase
MTAVDPLARDWAPKVGDKIPQVERGPISRGTLALFAGASNDHFFLHIDSDYAKDSGAPDVFAHGMLVMAYLCHALTSLVRPEDIKSWNVRFMSITQVHTTIICSGEVKDIIDQDGERCAVLDLAARDQNGQAKLIGEAIVVLHT